VLWVVPSERRAAFIRSAIDHTAGIPSGMFAIATTERAVGVLTEGEGAEP
jgi:hypothetical protein